MQFFRKNPFLAILLLSLVLGFSFMGSRSLFEPDEGRYTNVALMIADTNEWISLYRHPASLHFTKPPLTYWTIAASVDVFGFNTWAARLPIALAYIFSALMIYQLGKVFSREKPWLPRSVRTRPQRLHLPRGTLAVRTFGGGRGKNSRRSLRQ